jgi:hypothetical protein
MKAKEFWITALALAAIAAVSVLAYRHVTRPSQDLCQVCERSLHHGVNYRLEMADGTSETACCPRCGMHHQVERPESVTKAWATDLPTGESIAAESAYYIEGGDVEYCTMHEGRVQREPQGVAVRAFDRCLPTLIAFRTQQGAEAYRGQHGGEVLTYQQAVERVKRK